MIQRSPDERVRQDAIFSNKAQVWEFTSCLFSARTIASGARSSSWPANLKDPVPLLDMLQDDATDDVFCHRLALAALCLPEIRELLDEV